MGEQAMMVVEYRRASARRRARKLYHKDPVAGREKSRAWRKRNPDKALAYHIKYHKENATSRNSKARERRSKDPERARARAAEWKRKNPGRVRELRVTYNQKNRARVQELRRKWKNDNRDKSVVYECRRRSIIAGIENTLTISEWRFVLREYGWSCCYCGEGDAKMTMDHLVPVLLGGATSKYNIAPACQSCNSAKGTKTTAEFLWWRAKQGDHRACRMRIGA